MGWGEPEDGFVQGETVKEIREGGIRIKEGKTMENKRGEMKRRREKKMKKI